MTKCCFITLTRPDSWVLTGTYSDRGFVPLGKQWRTIIALSMFVTDEQLKLICTIFLGSKTYTNYWLGGFSQILQIVSSQIRRYLMYSNKTLSEIWYHSMLVIMLMDVKIYFSFSLNWILSHKTLREKVGEHFVYLTKLHRD